MSSDERIIDSIYGSNFFTDHVFKISGSHVPFMNIRVLSKFDFTKQTNKMHQIYFGN